MKVMKDNKLLGWAKATVMRVKDLTTCYDVMIVQPTVEDMEAYLSKFKNLKIGQIVEDVKEDELRLPMLEMKRNSESARLLKGMDGEEKQAEVNEKQAKVNQSLKLPSRGQYIKFMTAGRSNKEQMWWVCKIGKCELNYVDVTYMHNQCSAEHRYERFYFDTKEKFFTTQINKAQRFKYEITGAPSIPGPTWIITENATFIAEINALQTENNHLKNANEIVAKNEALQTENGYLKKENGSLKEENTALGKKLTTIVSTATTLKSEKSTPSESRFVFVN